MCTPTASAMLPYGLKIPSPYFPFGPGGGVAPGHLPSLDFQRSQINDYNARVQLGLRNYQHSLGLSPFHAYLSDPYAQAYFYKHDPRARFVQEEPKPSHSYIGLIGMAILNSKDKKLVLSDIYQWILDNYPYFRTRGPGWRNSIRHNLSLNDCFIKSGRSANGKGHYWAVHPANVEDFERGDFRRRRAQRKVRRHMGLSVPDDDDSPTPSPTQPWVHHDLASPESGDRAAALESRDDKRDLGALHGVVPQGPETPRLLLAHHPHHHHHHPHTPAYGLAGMGMKKPSRKRLFDMASLLAPDDDEELRDDAKTGVEKSYGDRPESPNNNNNSSNRHDADGIHAEGKYDDDIDRNVITNRAYDNHDLSDDEGDNDDDDDNIEEIHVTSDDESSAERSATLDNKSCDTDKRLSAECDLAYTERDNLEIDVYGPTHNNIDTLTPNKKEDCNTQSNSHVMLNGIIDKENILQNRNPESSHLKSHRPENNTSPNTPQNLPNNIIYDRRDPSDIQRHADALRGYRTPHIPHMEQHTHSLKMTTDHQAVVTSTVQERPSPVSPTTTRPADLLAIPLSISVNPSSFSPPIPISQQNNNNNNNNLVSGAALPRRSSEASEILPPNQTSLLFRGSPYKGDVPKMAADAKTVNGGIRRTSLDPASVQVSELMRLQAESFNWQAFPKDLVRERFSAFNVLDRGNPGLLSHFHQGVMRAVPPFTAQTMPLATHSTTLTQGISSPLQASTAISVASTPSPGRAQHNE